MIQTNDSLILLDQVWIPFASFHYAVIRDTFLYTASTGGYGLHCVNIEDPESISVAWSMEGYFGYNGLSIVDSFVYTSISTKFWVDPESDYHQRPHIQWLIAKISGDTSATMFDIEYMDNAHHGSLTADGSDVFYVYTEMSDFIWGVQDYTLGDSYLEVWGEDYSYTWSDYDSEGVFGVEVLNDTILAVGFEHGFSIIDYTQLGGMVEVAYYRDTDSIFCFTHFARKSNRMFAMAHPHPDTCRMYMFELDADVWSSIDKPKFRPEEFEFHNYPNPFNSECRLVINSDSDYRNSRLEIFDITGRRVYSENTPLNEGLNTFIWNPKNASSGLYLARITAGKYSITSKIVYIA